MYTLDYLSKYDYFKGADINFILDSLTGVLSRQYILDFARHLVDQKKEFTMCIIDLDNFKYINDSYGHHSGDICLKKIGEGLARCVGEDGIVGRFGGDEFIIIYLKSTNYDDIHKFLADIYGVNGAVRKRIQLENASVFVTATTGSASFPNDATNYSELFTKMDKALYRGKIKGRNCFIIYVHEKHKDIVINERGTNSLLSKILDLKHLVQNISDELMIGSIVDYLYRTLHVAKAFYIDINNDVKASDREDIYHYGNNAYFLLEKILGDKEIVSSSNPKEIKEQFPGTVEYMDKNRVHAYVIVKVVNGFIVFYENNVTRMWQDYDLVLIEFAATIINSRLKK